jgi:hypothetical protein
MPAEPEMDLDLLPPIIKEYSTELSETIGSDPAVSVQRKMYSLKKSKQIK